MNRKMLAFIAGIALVSFAIAGVCASSWAYKTPLYTMRMEQVSNDMHFLPPEMNDFTYTAENGYNLNYDVSAFSATTTSSVNFQTFDGSNTCNGSSTCAYSYTCPFTCNITCSRTCEPTACAPCPLS